MAEISVDTVYKIGDTITTHDGHQVVIADDEVGRLLIAAKDYARSIGALVGAKFVIGAPVSEIEDPVTEYDVLAIEFIDPSQVPK